MVFCLFVFGSFFAQAAKLPPVPANCFAQEIYCFKSWVATSPELNAKVIYIDFNAFLSSDDYPTPDEILPRFFAFDKWTDYTRGSRDIRMLKSEKWSPVVVNGREYLRHFVHYITRAPWPLEEAEIVELSHYSPLPAYEGAVTSWKFELIHDFNQNKGLAYKVGEVHLAQHEGGHRVFIRIALIPEINVLPEVALPFVEKAFLAIFKGMFDI